MKKIQKRKKFVNGGANPQMFYGANKVNNYNTLANKASIYGKSLRAKEAEQKGEFEQIMGSLANNIISNYKPAENQEVTIPGKSVDSEVTTPNLDPATAPPDYYTAKTGGIRRYYEGGGFNPDAVGTIVGGVGELAGSAVTQSTTDNNLATNTKQEKAGRVASTSLKTAGKWAGMAAPLGPAAMIAAGIGGAFYGATIGAKKANREADKEAFNIQNEAGAYGVASREDDKNNWATQNTGFGLTSSTNMNMQPTNYFQEAKKGGFSNKNLTILEGGVAKRIPGSDSVEFIGRSHDQGGIFPDPNTEVEGGETMKKNLKMANGKVQDYFFSHFLRLGGISFAKRHKEIEMSDMPKIQKEKMIQDLAKMQEEKAGRNPDKVGESGSIRKYELAGVYKKKPKVKNINTPNDYTGPYTDDVRKQANIPRIDIQEYYTDTENRTGDAKDKQPYYTLYDEHGYEIGRARSKEEAILRRDQFYKLADEGQLENYDLARDRYNYIEGFGVTVRDESDGDKKKYRVTDTSTGKQIITKNPNRVDRFAKRRLNKFAFRNDLDIDADALNEEDLKGVRGDLISEKDGYQIRTTPYEEEIVASHAPNKEIGYNVQVTPNQYPFRVFNQIGSDLKDYIGDYEADYAETDQALTDFLADKGTPQGSSSNQPGAPGAQPLPDYSIPELDNLNQGERKAFKVADSNSSTGYNTYYKEKDGKYKKYDETNKSWVDVDPKDYTGNTYSIYTPPTVTAPKTADEWLTQNKKTKDDLYTGLKDEIDNFDFNSVSSNPNRLPSTDLKDDSGNWISGAWKDLVGTDFGDLIGLKDGMSEDEAKAAYNDTWKTKVDEAINDPAKFELLKGFFQHYIDNKGESASGIKYAFGTGNITGLSQDKVKDVLEDQMKDGKFGPFHRSLIAFILGTGDTPVDIPEDPTLPDYVAPPREGKKPCPEGSYPDMETGECVPLPEMNFEEEKQSLIPALSQLIPVGYRLKNPYNKERGIPGNLSPERVSLGREQKNRDRQMAAQAYTAGVAAVRNMSGPGSLAGIQALQNKYNTTLQDISDKESKANIELNTREAAANAEIMSRAADQEMKRQSFNSSTRREEEKYRLERIESGLDAAAERITGIVKDEKLDRFNRDLTRVLDNTHSYDRLTIYNQIKKHSKMEDSPFYGKSDRQLQKIAAAYAKQIYGDLQIVTDTRNKEGGSEEGDVKKLGGPRKYTSRLGQLVNSGRRSFNI